MMSMRVACRQRIHNAQQHMHMHMYMHMYHTCTIAHVHET